MLEKLMVCPLHLHAAAGHTNAQQLYNTKVRHGRRGGAAGNSVQGIVIRQILSNLRLYDALLLASRELTE